MTLTQILTKLKSIFYIKSEVDTKLNNKASSSDLNNYLPLSGGQLTGNVINRNTDANYLEIQGGTAFGECASITLYGKDHSSKGRFYITACDGSERTYLTGAPGGLLSWGGKAIDVIEEQGENYIRYSNGIQMCWGVFRGLSTNQKTITFQKPFAPNYHEHLFISVTGQNNATTVVLEGWISTDFFVHGTANDGGNFMWQAIGRWR